MKKIIVTQSNYIPWKGYFDSINLVDELVLYDDVQYTKRDWRNRNIIKTIDGNKWLSVPVEVKGKYFQKINETKISEQDWGKSHWGVLTQNYGKAPFFKQYKSLFESLYLDNNEQYISKINYAFIKTICEILEIKTNIIWSNNFELVEGKTERLVDLCKKCGATDYFSGPSAKNYIDETLFEKEGIKVHYLDYSGYPEYEQLFPPFDHAVTMLDLIFNAGPEIKKYMKSFNKE